MNKREHTKSYVDYLESEIRRLSYENEKLRESKDVNNPFQTLDFEDNYSRNEWIVPRQASLTYKQYPEECRSIIRLKVGEYQSDLFCADGIVLTENILEEFIRVFLHGIFNGRIQDLKNRKEWLNDEDEYKGERWSTTRP